MAIFNNSDSQPKSDKTDTSTTIITSGAKIVGEINLSCNLYIDGELEGSITSNNEVNVGKHGHIKGNITTKRLIVQGFIDGKVDASKVEIKAEGKISGEVLSEEFIIESKGVFEGSSIVKQPNISPKIEQKIEKPKK